MDGLWLVIKHGGFLAQVLLPGQPVNVEFRGTKPEKERERGS